MASVWFNKHRPRRQAAIMMCVGLICVRGLCGLVLASDNVPIFPGETLRLHLFEPRYKLMMQRIVNSTRRYVTCQSSSKDRTSFHC